MKGKILLVIKFIFTTSILIWLIDSGKIEFSAIIKTLETPSIIIKVIVSLLLILVIGAMRWRAILNTFLVPKISLKNVTTYNWIGYFFNIFLPGAVSGDIVKAFYIKKLVTNVTYKFLAISVLLDRVVGIFGFFSILGISSIYFYLSSDSALPSSLNKLLATNIMIFSIATLLLALFYFTSFAEQGIKQVLSRLKIKKKDKLLEIVDKASSIKPSIPKLLLYSIVSQLITLFFFSVLADSISPEKIDSLVNAIVIPSGFIISSIPIAPAGIGVGHLAFEKIYSMFGVSGGANFFNLYLMWWITFSLLGFIPYLSLGTKIGLTKLKNEDL